MATSKKDDSSDGLKAMGNATMWAKSGNIYLPCEESVKELPSGQYTIEADQQRGIYWNHRETNLDGLLMLPDSASDEIIKEVELFWSREEKYREFEFLWKRGILLWGPPGSGKTSTVQQISKMIVERGGISVYVNNPKIGAVGLDVLRRIEKKRPVVVILEDLDAIIKQHGEAEMLALLDGELQIDNVIFIATTNYPENLDKRIVNRPSRFDIVKKIPMPNADARRMYLSLKNKRIVEADYSYEDDKVVTQISRLTKEKESLEAKQAPDSIDERDSDLARKSEIDSELESLESRKMVTVKEIDYWVSATEGYSIAHLKELLISVEVMGRPLSEVLKRLNKMITKTVSSSQNGDTAF